MPGVPFPPPSPPPKRRLALSNSSGNTLMLTRSTSFKSGTSSTMSGNSMPSTPTSGKFSSILPSLTTRTSTQRLMPNEVKAVHYVMRSLHKNGRTLIQNVPTLISRLPDHLTALIGFTRDDLILFFKRHNAIFQLHTDGTVSVKLDAVRVLINKNDINNNLQTSSSSSSIPSCQQTTASITASGIVIRIFPKYGILNMDNNEQVFFDIQSCHFETFNDLTCVLNPGDSMTFHAILGPKEGRSVFISMKIDFFFK